MSNGFSRENEDEVIQQLVAELPKCSKVCVDIGAKMLLNNNVANLIMNLGWRGFLFEKGIKGFQTLCREFVGYPICISHWRVTPNNVNYLLPEEFDVLSIDIDGQDYWVWKEMQARPPIVVIEYNPRRSGGVMPRDDRYEWKNQKPYDTFGASKDTMIKLGESKGYRVHGLNENNIFFVT